ncbi:hypothetical protein [Wukongibacter sp. M2B1]|uniref:hypothetical protein n=1 Tax=Wukongibacter sp. M2B1 TaxID=3088895 RepID=UPI003D79325D
MFTKYIKCIYHCFYIGICLKGNIDLIYVKVTFSESLAVTRGYFLRCFNLWICHRENGIAQYDIVGYPIDNRIIMARRW